MLRLFLSILIICLLQSNQLYSQTSQLETPDLNHRSRFGIFISPLSFFEIKNATAGLGISYRLSKNWEFTLEPGFLYDVWDKTYKTKGVRIIFTAMRFFSKSRLFYGLDARVKSYSFNDEQDFLNVAANDSLFKYPHRVKTTFIGLAPMFGIRAPLSKNNKFVFQFNVGLGAKYRFVSRKNIPEGFELHEKFYRAEEWLSSEYYGSSANGSAKSGFTFYFPLGARFFFFF